MLTNTINAQKEVTNKTCDHYDSHCACTAFEKVYVPSHFQRNEYCISLAHKRCPFFLGRLRNAGLFNSIKSILDQY